MSLATIITFTRLVISPFFLFIYLQGPIWGITPLSHCLILLILLILLESSDALDGYFARKLNQVTDFGKIFDPMTDSLARITIFLSFTMAPVNLPLGLVLVFIYRDAMISTLRTVCAFHGLALGARTSGKIKATLQAMTAFSVIFLMMFQAEGMISLESLTLLSTGIVTFVAIYTILSGMEYLFVHREQIKKALHL